MTPMDFTMRSSIALHVGRMTEPRLPVLQQVSWATMQVTSICSPQRALSRESHSHISMRSLLLLCFLAATAALRVPAAARRSAAPRMDGLTSTSARIEKMIADNKVMLFMKGNKLFPQCGFSNTATMILKAVTESANCDFETFDVLSDQDVREGIKEYSNWPTIPQCYIDGEFIGGCDLLIEMYQSGELAEMIEVSAANAE